MSPLIKMVSLIAFLCQNIVVVIGMEKKSAKIKKKLTNEIVEKDEIVKEFRDEPQEE